MSDEPLKPLFFSSWTVLEAPEVPGRLTYLQLGGDVPKREEVSDRLLAGLQFLVRWLAVQGMHPSVLRASIGPNTSRKKRFQMTIFEIDALEPRTALYDAVASPQAGFVRALQQGWERYLWRVWNIGPYFVRYKGVPVGIPDLGETTTPDAPPFQAALGSSPPNFITISSLPEEDTAELEGWKAPVLRAGGGHGT